MSGMTLGLLLEAETSGFIHLSQISHGAMTGTPRRSIGFQKNPGVMGFAVFIAAGFSDERIKLYRIVSILYKRGGLHHIAFLQRQGIHQAEKMK